MNKRRSRDQPCVEYVKIGAAVIITVLIYLVYNIIEKSKSIIRLFIDLLAGA